jgi:hypothetical protein
MATLVVAECGRAVNAGDRPRARDTAIVVTGLRGRAVLVTRAASGIGRATCARLAAEGAMVAMVDRDGAAVEAARPRDGCNLLSDDASYTNGEVIAVDGGATAR